jgi:hypothetical protein
MGLAVHKVKTERGTMNDSNTDQHFSEDPALLWYSPAIKELLIDSFLLILQRFSLERNVNGETYNVHALELKDFS